MAAQVNEPEAAVSFIKQAFHGNFNLNKEGLLIARQPFPECCPAGLETVKHL